MSNFFKEMLAEMPTFVRYFDAQKNEWNINTT